MRRRSNLLFILIIFLLSCQSNKTKIACIGDSITNGGGKDHSTAFYPVQLSHILGESYEVLNCGESGATMQSDGNKPFWNQKDLPNVFVYQPEIVVIMLGTNDSKTFNWNAQSYERDYQRMIDTLRTMPTNPQIYLCSPPPAYNSAWEISDSTIRAGVIPLVNKLADKNGLEVIDVYNSMTNMAELFPDGIHPNGAGLKIMAETVAKAIKN